MRTSANAGEARPSNSAAASKSFTPPSRIINGS
jgi:hypothetical protein